MALWATVHAAKESNVLGPGSRLGLLAKLRWRPTPSLELNSRRRRGCCEFLDISADVSEEDIIGMRSGKEYLGDASLALVVAWSEIVALDVAWAFAMRKHRITFQSKQTTN